MGILSDLFGGDGMAWRREQPDILNWAKNLYYPESGGSLIAETDNKSEWESWRNAFLNWKDAELGKPETSRWWYTYPRQGEESGGDLGRSPSSDYYSSPARQNNPYFPMLYEAFEPPAMQDWSGMPGFENSIFGQEYYQPWAADYPGSQWVEYIPPSFNTPIEYMSPLFAVEAIYPEEEGGSNGDKSSGGTTDLDDRGRPDRPGSDGKGVHGDDRTSEDLGMGMGGGYDHKGWDGTSAQTTGIGPAPADISPSDVWGGTSATPDDIYGGVDNDATYP